MDVPTPVLMVCSTAPVVMSNLKDPVSVASATRRTGDLDHEWSGGAAWCESLSSVISNCVVAGNSARAYGVIVNGTLLNCLLTNNTVGVSSCLLSNCFLADNYSSGAYGSSLYQCTIKRP